MFSGANANFAQAQALFNARQFFECHEVLESLWLPLSVGPEKQFLQGLLQVAVGFYHWQQGNFVGARNKLQEGLAKLAAVSGQREYVPPIQLDGLQLQTQTALDILLKGGPLAMPALQSDWLPILETRPSH